ncbi:MAG: alpha/beta hydrolase [Bacteroidales bacterium]|nr:alpha/beta hydrolase [Bacteroidales bacterium]
MKKYSLLFLFLISFFVGKAQYMPDELGKSFVKQTIVMPDDYEGKVVCTLVKQISDLKSDKAVLYVHGYNDYFYQAEMANRFTKAGYRFYALDLRKYGRSLLSNQVATNAKDMNEYFADIDTANAIIRHEGAKKIILIGHSMGGLTTSIYADAKGQSLKFDAMILNSPFFDFNENWFNENVAVPAVSSLGKLLPNMIIKAGTSTAYGESLHQKYHGEWSYDLNKKLLASGDKHWCWIRAIQHAQLKVKHGLNIQCPILSLSSDKSIRGETWNNDFQTADAVLDVKDIQLYSKNLGKRTTIAIIPGAMHDVILSKQNVRDAAYREMFDWLASKGL